MRRIGLLLIVLVVVCFFLIARTDRTIATVSCFFAVVFGGTGVMIGLATGVAFGGGAINGWRIFGPLGAIIGWGFGLVLMLFVQDTSLSWPPPTASEAPTFPASTTTIIPTVTETSNSGQVGDRLIVQGVGFRVDKVNRVLPERIAQGQRHLILEITLENVSQSDGVGFDGYEGFFLIDGQGNTYDKLAPTFGSLADQSAIELDPNWTDRPNRLPLGKTATGVIGFQIDEDASGFTLIHKSLIFSENSLSQGPEFQVDLGQ